MTASNGVTGAAALLELRAVTCERGGRALFSDLSCQVASGQLLRVSGANGSGKTSMLRMVCGLLPPARGQIFWRGRELAGQAQEFACQLVYLGHSVALKDDLSAQENLHIACLLGGRTVGSAQIGSALRQAGLGGREHVAARLLSQGQRRRIALTRLALSAVAPLWVLDEPFNALDTTATEWLRGLIAAHLAQGGLVVLTSHQDVGLDHLDNQLAVAL